LIIILVVILLIVFFYPKSCDTRKINLIQPTCFGYKVIKENSLPVSALYSTTCYGICIRNENSCNSLYTQIDNELKSANYCNIDADCKVLPLGARYVEFGCYHYINKDIDGEQIYQKMNDYWNTCSQIIDDCANAPESKCENNKCVEKI